MKKILILLVSSLFLFLSCGDDDSSNPEKEKYYYQQSAVIFCQKAFECDQEIYKGGKTDVSQCEENNENVQGCSMNGLHFNSKNAEECLACSKKLSCDDYFTSDMQFNGCDMCKHVCE